jgi:acetyl esterase
MNQPSLTWLQKIVGAPPPGTPAPVPIASVEMIPQRRAALHFDELVRDLPPIDQLHEGIVLRRRDGYDLTAEVCVPAGPGPFPAMLYMHGGAFCVWSARDVRRIAFRIASAGFVVVNLNYGLAPEHPFPCAVEDAIYAARWTATNATRFGGVEGPISIGGDSAGGALSAAAIAYLDGGCPADLDEGDLASVPVSFSSAFLNCGVYDMTRIVQAERQTTPGTVEVMTCAAYLGTHWLPTLRDPMASPYFAPNLACFPPAYLSCGSDDPVLGQTLLMTERLAEFGVPVTTSIVPGFDHELLLIDPGREPLITEEWDRTLAWLHRHTRQ